MSNAAEKRTYLLRTRNDGQLRIEIPENWKVTFGPISPGSRSLGGELALRIYESDTKQRAIFTDVLSFRDLSIPVQKRVVARKSKAEAESDGKGKHSASQESLETEEWVSIGGGDL